MTDFNLNSADNNFYPGESSMEGISVSGFSTLPVRESDRSGTDREHTKSYREVTQEEMARGLGITQVYVRYKLGITQV